MPCPASRNDDLRHPQLIIRRQVDHVWARFEFANMQIGRHTHLTRLPSGNSLIFAYQTVQTKYPVDNALRIMQWRLYSEYP